MFKEANGPKKIPQRGASTFKGQSALEGSLDCATYLTSGTKQDTVSFITQKKEVPRRGHREKPMQILGTQCTY